MHVLVTGANGFVGQHCVAYLLKRGMRVTAAVRSGSSGIFPDSCSVRYIDRLDDEDIWSSALVGVDAIVHLAAHVHVMRGMSENTEQLYQQVNVDGTQSLINSCIQSGVQRFVYLSSIKVNGEASFDRPFRFDDDPRPQDAYGRSKLAAERLVRKMCSEYEIGWTIIRPPVVYGPQVKANFLRLIRLSQSGWPIPLGGCHNRRSVVYVDNLCDLISRVLDDDRACGETLMVSDGQDLSVAELIKAIAFASGRASRLFPVPGPVLSGLGVLLGKKDQIDRLTQPLEVDIGATTQILNWHPPYSVSEALKRTLDD